MRRVYLGISGRDRPLDRRLVRALSLEVEQAVEIISIEPASPSSQADLRMGDLIIGADAIAVESLDSLHRFLSRWPLGTALELRVLRGTRLQTVQVTPRELKG